MQYAEDAIVRQMNEDIEQGLRDSNDIEHAITCALEEASATPMQGNVDWDRAELHPYRVPLPTGDMARVNLVTSGPLGNLHDIESSDDLQRLQVGFFNVPIQPCALCGDSEADFEHDEHGWICSDCQKEPVMAGA